MFEPLIAYLSIALGVLTFGYSSILLGRFLLGKDRKKDRDRAIQGMAVSLLLFAIAYYLVSVNISQPGPSSTSSLIENTTSSSSFQAALCLTDRAGNFTAGVNVVGLRLVSATNLSVISQFTLSNAVDKIEAGAILVYYNGTYHPFLSGQLKVGSSAPTLSAFLSDYRSYMGGLVHPGDSLVGLTWNLNGSGITSYGTWGPNCSYRYDSLMHWFVKYQTYNTSRTTAVSVTKAYWTVLLGRFANGLGSVAFNYTMSGRADVNATNILACDKGWVTAMAVPPYDGNYSLTPTSGGCDIRTLPGNLQEGAIGFNVSVVCNLKVPLKISGTEFDIPLGQSFGRSGFLYLYSDGRVGTS